MKNGSECVYKRLFKRLIMILSGLKQIYKSNFFLPLILMKENYMSFFGLWELQSYPWFCWAAETWRVMCLKICQSRMENLWLFHGAEHSLLTRVSSPALLPLALNWKLLYSWVWASVITVWFWVLFCSLVPTLQSAVRLKCLGRCEHQWIINVFSPHGARQQVKHSDWPEQHRWQTAMARELWRHRNGWVWKVPVAQVPWYLVFKVHGGVRAERLKVAL